MQRLASTPKPTKEIKALLAGAITSRRPFNICNRDGGHFGGQEQKIIPRLGTNLLFYANSAKQIFFLSNRIVALSRCCKLSVCLSPF